MAKLKKYDIVEIKWIDSIHASGGWKFLNDLHFGDKERMYYTSIGYFTGRTPLSVVIVQSLQDKQYADGDRCVDSVMEIPSVAIMSMKKL